jgi:hypothetical protein
MEWYTPCVLVNRHFFGHLRQDVTYSLNESGDMNKCQSDILSSRGPLPKIFLLSHSPEEESYTSGT